MTNYATLRQVSNDRFGTELARDLRFEGQIIAKKDKTTLIHDENNQQKYKHGDEYYWFPHPKRENNEYSWFALITGKSSNLMVLDADNQDAIDFLDNLGLVRSYDTSSDNHEVGAHYYFQYEEINLSLPAGIDFLTNGILCHFHSPGKSAGEIVLNDTSHLFTLTKPLCTPPSSDDSSSLKVTSDSSSLIVNTDSDSTSLGLLEKIRKKKQESKKRSGARFYAQMETMQLGKYRLEKNENQITKVWAGQIKNLKAGERNGKLHKTAVQAIKLGWDVQIIRDLAEPIISDDFSHDEVEKVIQSAYESLDQENARTLDERILFWHSGAFELFEDDTRTEAGRTLVDLIAALGIYHHTNQPQINVTRILRREGINIKTFYAKLKVLDDAGYVKVLSGKGFSNNYQLCIDRTPIADKTLYRQIDELIDQDAMPFKWIVICDNAVPMDVYEHRPDLGDPEHYKTDGEKQAWLASMAGERKSLAINHPNQIPQIEQPEMPIPASPVLHREPQSAGEGKDMGTNIQTPTAVNMNNLRTQWEELLEDQLSIDTSNLEEYQVKYKLDYYEDCLIFPREFKRKLKQLGIDADNYKEIHKALCLDTENEKKEVA